MRLKLTRLVWITCIALLGIIALQVFWLLNAYKEQEKKLLTDANDALQEAMIFTGTSPMMREAARSMVNKLLKDYADGKIKLNDSSKLARGLRQVSAREIAMSIGDPQEREDVLRLVELDSARYSYTVQQFKTELGKRFRMKHIDIPFELAILGINGAIRDCTIDSNAFRKIVLATEPNYSILLSLNAKLSGHAKLAFPGAVYYLLKGMWLILLLSIVLTIICAFSFSYMVALFYRQKRLAEIRNDFMNNMTHELKTPISSVSVALELLKDDSVTITKETRDEYFKIAGNELGRLTMLVDKVLNMAAFQKMQIKLNRTLFGVKDWAASVLQAIKPLAEANHANIALNIRPDPGLMCFADEGQMSAVLQNLVENAIKYRDRNKLALNIDIAAFEDEEAFHLEVRDNGMGIPGEHIPRIFDKFFRVPTGDEHETRGYGLGLSYVHEIVRLHGGTIDVESELKKGTAFLILIPKIR